MDRAQKQESIEALKGVFEGAGAVVVTHNLGLTVAEMTDLRLRLRLARAGLADMLARPCAPRDAEVVHQWSPAGPAAYPSATRRSEPGISHASMRSVVAV